jgi:hypothetical protein
MHSNIDLIPNFYAYIPSDKDIYCLFVSALSRLLPTQTPFLSFDEKNKIIKEGVNVFLYPLDIDDRVLSKYVCVLFDKSDLIHFFFLKSSRLISHNQIFFINPIGTENARKVTLYKSKNDYKSEKIFFKEYKQPLTVDYLSFCLYSNIHGLRLLSNIGMYSGFYVHS